MVAASLLATTPVNTNVNLQWLGLSNYGINNVKIDMKVPTALLWMAGISCAFHLYRQVRHMKRKFMTWIYSFFNARKYLSPISDKYPDDPRLRK